MKTLTKFQAEDGVLFDTIEAAEKRDALVARCKEITAMLPPRVTDSGARTQHDPAALDAYRTAVVKLCREQFPNEPVFCNDPKMIHPSGWAGRFLDDAAPRCINRLWHRLMCCNGNDEYEQPFFALNPNEWKQA